MGRNAPREMHRLSPRSSTAHVAASQAGVGPGGARRARAGPVVFIRRAVRVEPAARRGEGRRELGDCGGRGRCATAPRRLRRLFPARVSRRRAAARVRARRRGGRAARRGRFRRAPGERLAHARVLGPPGARRARGVRTHAVRQRAVSVRDGELLGRRARARARRLAATPRR